MDTYVGRRREEEGSGCFWMALCERGRAGYHTITMMTWGGWFKTRGFDRS